MSETPASTAPLSDDELRETLDRLGDLTLKLYDRVEEQTKAISHATTMAKEARRAAEATQQQTDPDYYAEYAVEVIDNRLKARMDHIKQTSSDLFRVSSYTREVLDKADLDRSNAQRQLWEREHKLDRFKSRLRWVGLGAVVLVLALSLVLSRFLASNPSTCAILGASWTTTTTGVDACVFYQR